MRSNILLLLDTWLDHFAFFPSPTDTFYTSSFFFIMQHTPRCRLGSDKPSGAQGNSRFHLSCQFTILPAQEKPEELFCTNTTKTCFFLMQSIYYCKLWASQVLWWQQKVHFSPGFKLQKSGCSQRPPHWGNCSRLEQITNSGEEKQVLTLL